MHTTNHECDAMSVKPPKTPPTVPIIPCFNNTNIFHALYKVSYTTLLYYKLATNCFLTIFALNKRISKFFQFFKTLLRS